MFRDRPFWPEHSQRLATSDFNPSGIAVHIGPNCVADHIADHLCPYRLADHLCPYRPTDHDVPADHGGPNVPNGAARERTVQCLVRLLGATASDQCGSVGRNM